MEIIYLVLRVRDFPISFSEWDVSTIQRPDRKGSGLLGLQQV